MVKRSSCSTLPKMAMLNKPPPSETDLISNDKHAKQTSPQRGL